MGIGSALRAFITVFVAELPDKTMVATVVLTARFRQPLAVWIGVALAFTIHVTVAVTAGQLLSLLPDTVVSIATIVLFAGGAVVLWRDVGGEGAEAEGSIDPAAGAADAESAGPRRAIVSSFVVVFLAEWGDLTQLATASLAADSGAPIATGLGALAALLTVAGLAVTIGASLASRLPVRTIKRLAAVVFALLALVTLVELIRS